MLLTLIFALWPSSMSGAGSAGNPADPVFTKARIDARTRDAPRGQEIDNGVLSSKVAVRLFLGDRLVVSLEYGCPPPGLLACGAGLRVRVKLNERSGSDLVRNFGDRALRVLARVGYTDLEIAHVAPDGSSGQITTAGSNLWRWMRTDDVFEAVGGDLELRPQAKLPSRASSQSAGDRAGPVEIEVDPKTLGFFLSSLSSATNE